MRIKKLVRPKMQLRITMWFVSLAACTLLLQLALFSSAFSELAVDLGSDAAQNFDLISAAYVRVLVLSFAIVLPVTTLLGVVSTFRVAGPVHRLVEFLTEVRDGGKPADCRIRSGDELQDLCALVNEITAEQRGAATTAPEREAA